MRFISVRLETSSIPEMQRTTFEKMGSLWVRTLCNRRACVRWVFRMVWRAYLFNIDIISSEPNVIGLCNPVGMHDGQSVFQGALDMDQPMCRESAK